MLRISRGMLQKLVRKVSAALSEPYEALLALLAEENQLSVDETGHKENGKRLWTWCFRAYLYTVYKISPSRGSKVLVDVPGEEFNGILGCDDLRKLFNVIHRREEYAPETTFRRALERARDQLVWDATRRCPQKREAQNLARRFRENADSYFRFITEPCVEPTNNLADQAIRFVAVHRRITQGTRGEVGRQWCERIWTIIQTCRQQQRSVFEFMCAAVEAHFRSDPAPSLVPDTS